MTIPELLAIEKYPRTRHLQGSRLQEGDHDLTQLPARELVGRHVVVEEKVDGANMGISFTPRGELLLQSRGHYLTGGSAHEDQFDIVKAWAQTMRGTLWELLGGRYVMYGESMVKKHSCFYDHLPHFFMEFDVFDRERRAFLSTELRRILFAGSPVVSVPVLWEGTLRSEGDLLALHGRSLCKSPAWREAFEEEVRGQGLDMARAWRLTDDSDLAEGLYVKCEGDDVEERFKWIRASFHQTILRANEDARGHVAFQPTIRNRLAPGVELFAMGGGA
jgi:hypothetical protein